MLDVCSGTGDLALAYHRAAGDRVPIVGADFCRPMLDVGQAKRRRAGADRLTFVVADAERLPFPSESFQIVSVAFGLRNVSDTDRGLAEMARVCRTGGSVAVLEFSTPTWQPLCAILWLVLPARVAANRSAFGPQSLRCLPLFARKRRSVSAGRSARRSDACRGARPGAIGPA